MSLPDIPCPTCGAPAGSPCVAKSGKPQARLHVARAPATTTVTRAAHNYAYTPEMGEKLADLLRTGLSIQTAALAVGIARSTLYKWLDDARTNPDSDYRELAEKLAQARAEGEAWWASRIVKAAEEHVTVHKPMIIPGQGVARDDDGNILYDTRTSWDWRAAAWVLQRRYGDDWRTGEEMIAAEAQDAATATRLRANLARLAELTAQVADNDEGDVVTGEVVG